MKFNNRPNPEVKLSTGETVWLSRSVAVDCIIIGKVKDDDELYIVTTTRGPKSADFQGHQNLIAGYLDWDESATEAIIRETWEEVGINIRELFTTKRENIIHEDIMQPWDVNTEVTNNKQNVSLRFGFLFEVDTMEELPVLTTRNNEVEGECLNPLWLPLSEMGDYPHWAFKHEQLIFRYLWHLAKLDKINIKFNG